MPIGTIGVQANSPDSRQVLATIQDLERRGLPAAWLTTGGAGLDGLSLFAAAAVQTQRIRLGTCIIPTWPRHPVAAVQQIQVIAQLAPGRFRFGVGPSHKAGMMQLYGADFEAPLTNLREYLQVVRTLLHEGKVDFNGRYYRTQASIPAPIRDVPVMASALRPASYETCGELADGAISWVCPGVYLRDTALPAMKGGADRAGRPTPPLLAHTPVCVHENAAEVRAAVLEQLGNYPRNPFYTEMFKTAGLPEASSGTWSDAMIDAVVFSGNEQRVEQRIRQMFDWGASELIVTVVSAGADRAASRERTLRLLASLAAVRA